MSAAGEGAEAGRTVTAGHVGAQGEEEARAVLQPHPGCAGHGSRCRLPSSLACSAQVASQPASLANPCRHTSRRERGRGAAARAPLFLRSQPSLTCGSRHVFRLALDQPHGKPSVSSTDGRQGERRRQRMWTERAAGCGSRPELTPAWPGLPGARPGVRPASRAARHAGVVYRGRGAKQAWGRHPNSGRHRRGNSGERGRGAAPF